MITKLESPGNMLKNSFEGGEWVRAGGVQINPKCDPTHITTYSYLSPIIFESPVPTQISFGLHGLIQITTMGPVLDSSGRKEKYF